MKKKISDFVRDHNRELVEDILTSNLVVSVKGKSLCCSGADLRSTDFFLIFLYVCDVICVFVPLCMSDVYTRLCLFVVVCTIVCTAVRCGYSLCAID